jgi:hypothetical protein
MMMRAKDYAYRYLQDPTDENLAKIATEFLLEIPAIARLRTVKNDPGFLSIVREQDQKWRCFVRKVNKDRGKDVREDGLALLIKLKYPDLFSAVWPHLSISEDIAPLP